MLKKYLLIILVFCALICAACFSPWKGDEGTVSIRIDGGNAGSRQAAWLDKDIIPYLKHTITLEGPGPKQTRSDIKYGGSVKFSVTPGLWNISVIAEEVRQTPDGETRSLIAAGFDNVVIKPGLNNVKITIQPVSGITVTFELFEISFDQIINGEEAIIDIPYKYFIDEKYIISLKDPEQYDNDGIEWNCKGIKGSGPSFILDLHNDYYFYITPALNGEEYYFYIMVEVRKDGIPYGKSFVVSVTVPDGD